MKHIAQESQQTAPVVEWPELLVTDTEVLGSIL
jgi:hypothetical protein